MRPVNPDAAAASPDPLALDMDAYLDSDLSTDSGSHPQWSPPTSDTGLTAAMPSRALYRTFVNLWRLIAKLASFIGAHEDWICGHERPEAAGLIMTLRTSVHDLISQLAAVSGADSAKELLLVLAHQVKQVGATAEATKAIAGDTTEEIVMWEQQIEQPAVELQRAYPQMQRLSATDRLDF